MLGATGHLLLKEKAKGRAILESRLRGMGECGRLTAATTTETSIVPRLPRCHPEEVEPTKDPDGARRDLSQCPDNVTRRRGRDPSPMLRMTERDPIRAGRDALIPPPLAQDASRPLFLL